MSTLDRRSFLKYAGLAGVGAAIAACGGGSGGEGGGAADPAAAASGQLTGTATFTTWAGDQELVAYKKLAADFKAQRGADVTIEVLPYDQIRTVVDRRLQARQAPDLFRVSYTDVGTYADQGVLADMTEYLGEGFGDQFLPALWGAVLTPDGAPFGVPQHTDVSALVYNKAHFEKAGITSVPATLEEAWTWEQFVQVLEQLKAADLGAAPFAFNYQLFGAFRWLNTLWQAGGTVLNENLDAVTLDTPEARKALEWTQSLYTKGLHEPSVLVKRPTYPDEIFPTQKISMIQAGDFLVPSLEDTIGSKFEWGATYLMKDVGAATDLGGNAVVMTAEAKNPDVAAEFAKFLVTKENMQYFCEETAVLPVRNDLVDAKLAFKVRPDLMPVFQQQVSTLPETLVKTSTSPSFPGVNQALIDNMDQYLSNPDASTDSVIQGLTASIDKVLQA